MFKKLSLVSLGILSCSALYAGAPGDQVTTPTGVILTAPNSDGLWTFGLEGSDVKASGNNFTYGELSPLTASGTSTHTNETVTNHSHWGYAADIDYQFTNSSRDVKLAYSQYELHDSNQVTVPQGQVFLAPIVVPPFAFGIVDGTQKGTVENDVSSIDLLFGQMFSIGSRLDMHPFAGLRWSDLSIDNKANYNSFFSGGSGHAQKDFKITSDFQGIGPRAGVDVTVHAGSGVSFVGTMAVSVLVGDLDSKYNDYLYGPSVLTPVSTYYKNDDEKHVVPEFDARLGMNYHGIINPTFTYNLQVGYQAVNYYDVVNTDWQDMNTPNTINNSSDFGYYGPYLRVELKVA